MKVLCQTVRIGGDETIFNYQAVLVLDDDGDVSWFHEAQSQATKKTGARITTVDEFPVVLSENPQRNEKLLRAMEDLVSLENISESQWLDVSRGFDAILSQVFQAGIRYARSTDLSVSE